MLILARMMYRKISKIFTPPLTPELEQMLITGDLTGVRRICEAHPALIHAENNEGTPLHIAVQYAHLDVVTWLINHGALVNTQNIISGKTALDLAREQLLANQAQQEQYQEIIRLLTQEPQVEAPADPPFRFPAIPVSLLLLALSASMRLLQQRPSDSLMQAPVWPSGMTGLSNSDANFAWMNNQDQGFVTFQNVLFPFDGVNRNDYPGLAKLTKIMDIGRASGNHEDFDVGLKEAITHIHHLLSDKNTMLSECYIYLWAFLAEHGRQTATATSYGIDIYLTSEQQLKLRTLEALRAGLEEYLKAIYPDLVADLSCNNVQYPQKQLNALEKMVQRDRTFNPHHYQKRINILSHWQQILREQHIGTSFVLENNAPRFDSLIESAMRTAMENKNCPWWQTPLNYFSSTAKNMKTTLCAVWRNTSPGRTVINNNEDPLKYRFR